MQEYMHDRTCVYSLRYHVIWCVKYRKKVLTPEIASRLCESIEDIGESKGFVVEACKVKGAEHVHCYVKAPPKISVTQIVKYLKGISGTAILNEFPDLREQLWHGQLWNGSYFCETLGSESGEEAEKYLDKQKNCQM